MHVSTKNVTTSAVSSQLMVELQNEALELD